MAKKKKNEVELTLQQKRDYIDGGGEQCPNCESYKLGEEMQWREDSATFESVEFCHDCNLRWTAVYELVAIDHIHIREGKL